MTAAVTRHAAAILDRLSGRPVELLSAAWGLSLVVGFVDDESLTGLGLRWLLLATAGFLIGIAWTGWIRQRAERRRGKQQGDREGLRQ